MSEIIERVARALYSEDDPDAWNEAVRIAARFPDEKHLQEDVNDTRAQARRVIEAMREPTPAMCLSGDGASSHVYGSHYDTRQEMAEGRMFPAWQAMIDEALK